jgi:hypothetical protein
MLLTLVVGGVNEAIVIWEGTSIGRLSLDANDGLRFFWVDLEDGRSGIWRRGVHFY